MLNSMAKINTFLVIVSWVLVAAIIGSCDAQTAPPPSPPPTTKNASSEKPVVVKPLLIRALKKPVTTKEKCPSIKCAPSPKGLKCVPKFEKKDKCCPVWTCLAKNGDTSTFYGANMVKSSTTTTTFTKKS
ncbi:unnamed protein product [Allacma fusca]|uniref:Uncharacterized protein n=1 Tax=Allacma fusca TaxID=39272 RepID=A0A8J2LJW3_9HEXA|nr:unnamed protein product [Allacma fusca]